MRDNDFTTSQVVVDKEIFQDSVKSSIDFLTADYTRLQFMEREYNKLIELVYFAAEKCPQSGNMAINIRVQEQLKANSFKELLESSEWSALKG